MEEKDYISESELFSTAAKLYTNTLFSTESIISMLDEYYKDANTVYNPSPIVTWDHPALVTNAINSSDPEKLHAKHVSHSTRVHSLLDNLKTLPASKLSVNTYHNQLLSLSLYLRDDETSLLTKDGMILCNDIYNWYESVK